VGAVPGHGLVARPHSLPLPPSPLFDVERFRAETTRLAVARSVTGPTLVMGSTQPAQLVDPVQAKGLGIEVLRRRGGGGAVFLLPDDQLWIDAWIPRADSLWDPDVSAAAAWVGGWWVAALETLGLSALTVHTGRAVPGPLGSLVCFAGRGPGEVFQGARKVMGLSQWRSRQGTLFSTCAYRQWDPSPLVELLGGGSGPVGDLVGALGSVAVGVAELHPPVGDLALLQSALLRTFHSWP
jgi:lipoate---protein ligase